MLPGKVAGFVGRRTQTPETFGGIGGLGDGFERGKLGALARTIFERFVIERQDFPSLLGLDPFVESLALFLSPHQPRLTISTM